MENFIAPTNTTTPFYPISRFWNCYEWVGSAKKGDDFLDMKVNLFYKGKRWYLNFQTVTQNQRADFALHIRSENTQFSKRVEIGKELRAEINKLNPDLNLSLLDGQMFYDLLKKIYEHFGYEDYRIFNREYTS